METFNIRVNLDNNVVFSFYEDICLKTYEQKLDSRHLEFFNKLINNLDNPDYKDCINSDTISFNCYEKFYNKCLVMSIINKGISYNTYITDTKEIGKLAEEIINKFELCDQIPYSG